MKRIMRLAAIPVCALLCLLAAAACGAESSDAGSNAVPVVSSDVDARALPPSNGPTDGPVSGANAEAAAEPAPLSMEEDMGISVNGRWFPIWQDAAGLLQALGDDYELTSAPSCVFEGEDKEFAYDGCFVFTNPDGDRDIWYSMYLVDDTLSTARGIMVDSSLDEVMSEYGDRYFWEGDSILTYSISGVQGDIDSPCIQFTVAEERVTAIEIYYPTNTA